ncbi:MAG: protein-L-isoaspartate O-methyltransferase [Thermoprotei archaeon]|nr:MAG: protein-L-isoaspartate O-methyltransferase [Thermoprotei archaeon]RLF03197.1 MAG: protein-L-isoaspartate O-methyltransferase [Thermoprotei archaeon]
MTGFKEIYEEERKRLVMRLIEEGYVRSQKVARAMLKVPRECFVPTKYARYAYEDSPLPTLCGQTISAPHMCALMCEELDLKKGEIVLEIGTGSGYHAALCAEIVAPQGSKNPGHVYTLEIFWQLVCFARRNLERAGYLDRVSVFNADGSFTLPFRINFDKILVTASAPRIPETLIKRLKVGGRMVIPIGGTFIQELIVVDKVAEDKYITKSRGGCVFVKLLGKHGFKDWYNFI